MPQCTEVKDVLFTSYLILDFFLTFIVKDKSCCKAAVPNSWGTGPWFIWYQAAQKKLIIYITLFYYLKLNNVLFKKNYWNLFVTCTYS